MSAGSAKNVLIVAGEASGDMHGANLVRAVHDINPEIDFWGLGGEKMREAGVKIPFDSTRLAVVGISEVFAHLWQIVQAQRLLRKAMRDKRPDLVILIDYPDFNLLLAAKARSLGIPVMYYISPQVWAWRSGRVKKIRRLVNRMVVILPFEVEFYRGHQMEVDFVGHPLLDIIKPTMDENNSPSPPFSKGGTHHIPPLEKGDTGGFSNESVFYKRFEIDRSRPIVGLFPGSRLQEVNRLMPSIIDAAGRLEEKIPGIQFVLPLAPTIDRRCVEDFIHSTGLKIRVIEDGIYDTMKAARAVIAASGTVTLEAAIMGVPMIIVYKVSKLSYLVGKIMVRVSHIGLVNLVAGRRIVPELVQEEVNGRRIAEEVHKIIVDEKYSRTMKNELEGVKNKLGGPGASARVAEIVCQMVKGKSSRLKAEG
ncbi:MAG TPA: lipid-A-disaccharide synthase [Proteobacteria bacterium]|nr:lipid-A-disaccharide synthase [Pseudomonadota bacterium]